MNGPVTARWRNRSLAILGIIVMIAALIGTVSWVIHTEDIAKTRDRNTQIICVRQDQIVEVLKYLVSSERQELLRPGSPTAAQDESDRRIRSLVVEIGDSNCTELNP